MVQIWSQPLCSGPGREGRKVRMVRGRDSEPGLNRRAALEAVGIGVEM